ncbi:hypothetical protein QJQ45_004129 [Haematococcus lacustris]|nr:hypothetical protein QJQ45_004129 [Haematococcus lacustris]
MQRIGESKWRPLELCWWPEQGKLPAKGKEYPGLGYKRPQDKPPKAQEQQQQPAEAQIRQPGTLVSSNTTHCAKQSILRCICKGSHKGGRAGPLSAGIPTPCSGVLRAAHIATVHANVGHSTPPGKQREERRAEWKTQRRQVITVPGGAALCGCKKTKRKLKAHFQLRAEIHSQLRIIASLFVLRIFLTPARPVNWKPPAGQVEERLVRPAWSQLRDLPVRGMMWCPVVAPRKPPQAPRSSQQATQPAASEPGPSSPLPAKRSKRTKAGQPAEPTQPTKGKGTGKGKAAKAKPAPQPGRWLDRDCNAALNMQRIGESKWRPLELCWWPEQGKLPAKGKEYPGLGYKQVRDKPPKAQEQQQQPAAAQ